MKGFKDFVMRGNLVELAVAFIMAAAFADLVKSFVQIVLDLLGKLGGKPDFSSFKPGGISVGGFLTALIAFVILAAVIYFFMVKPYELAKARFVRTEVDEAPDENIVLLREIRDSLVAERHSGTP